MIGAFIEVVGGTVLIVLLIALIAAIIIGIGAAFLIFVIGPILLLIGTIMERINPEIRKEHVNEKI